MSKQLASRNPIPRSPALLKNEKPPNNAHPRFSTVDRIRRRNDFDDCFWAVLIPPPKDKSYNSAHMKRRRLALVASIVVVLMSASAIGYALKKRVDKKLEEQKRAAFYTSALSSYSKDLEPGMTRNNVENYLRAKAIPFEKSAATDLVEIGQEAAPWFCSEVNVYVAFDFEAIEPHSRAWEPYGTDVLKRVHIYSRAGGCL
jgi:hypothetical protein